MDAENQLGTDLSDASYSALLNYTMLILWLVQYALVVVIYSNDFQHVVQVLRAVHRVQFVRRGHAPRNNRADYSRHVLVLDQAAWSCGDNSVVGLPPKIKGRVCMVKTAFCKLKMV